ncbi:MAG: CAP domain-containing protein [Bacteroidetes bacterium]|nr:CAP domain-containing protein [Bacteroidota bacterium]
MGTLFFSLFLALIGDLTPTQPPAPAEKVAVSFHLDNMAAFDALAYLNEIREHPHSYVNELGVELQGVPVYLSRLRVNPVLMQVAEQKALDMAQRDYFAHVDPDGVGINLRMHEAGYALPEPWRDEPHENNFESLAAGLPDGRQTIRALIVDDGVPGLQHRKHLLGLTRFYAGCTDVGIAFVRARGTVFRTYCCIIIARQY